MAFLSLYCFSLIVQAAKLFWKKMGEAPEDYSRQYFDDEPDGSNYVTLPNGDRRLD
jgi:hypothetical protein